MTRCAPGILAGRSRRWPLPFATLTGVCQSLALFCGLGTSKLLILMVLLAVPVLAQQGSPLLVAGFVVLRTARPPSRTGKKEKRKKEKRKKKDPDQRRDSNRRTQARGKANNRRGWLTKQKQKRRVPIRLHARRPIPRTKTRWVRARKGFDSVQTYYGRGTILSQVRRQRGKTMGLWRRRPHARR